MQAGDLVAAPAVAELVDDGQAAAVLGFRGGVADDREAGGRVALRQSTDPDSPALILEPDEIRAFVLGAKAGLADDLLT